MLVILVLFCILATLVAVNISPNTVQLYNRRNLTGSSKYVNISSCVSLEYDESFDEQVASINTFGSCVMVYHDLFCLGFMGQAAAVSTPIISDTSYFGFKISSLGPCPANCSSPSFEKGRTYVSFSAASGAEVSNSLMLTPGECLNIPHQFKRGHKQLINLSNPLCVQFYKESSCKGDSKMFPVSDRYQESYNFVSDLTNLSHETSLSFDILPEKWQLSGSISLCGFNCIGSPKAVPSILNHPSIQPPMSTTIKHRQKISNYSSSPDLQSVPFNSQLTPIFRTLFSDSLNSNRSNEAITPVISKEAIEEVHTVRGNNKENKNILRYIVFVATIGISFVFIIAVAVFYRRYKIQRRQDEFLILSNVDDYL